MNAVVIPNPALALHAEVGAFDEDPSTALAESSLRELIGAFPYNADVSHVLLKVIAINRLYRARVLDKDMEALAIHIAGIASLDQRLASGSTEAVIRIHDSKGPIGNIIPSQRSSVAGTTRMPIRYGTTTLMKPCGLTRNGTASLNSSVRTFTFIHDYSKS